MEGTVHIRCDIKMAQHLIGFLLESKSSFTAGPISGDEYEIHIQPEMERKVKRILEDTVSQLFHITFLTQDGTKRIGWSFGLDKRDAIRQLMEDEDIVRVITIT